MNPTGQGNAEISADDEDGVLVACGLVGWGCVVGRAGVGIVACCPGIPPLPIPPVGFPIDEGC